MKKPEDLVPDAKSVSARPQGLDPELEMSAKNKTKP